MHAIRALVCGLLVVPAASLASCRRDDEGAPRERVVVVYTALDRSFSEPIFETFQRRTGIRVKPLYDTESTKSVGLANRIRVERTRPRCDVFWNNEPLNTVRLRDEGLLEVYRPREADRYGEAWQDPGGAWHGFAARARVLIVNTELVSSGDFPSSLEDLADPAWRGRTAIAKPLFGTTASHVACLLAASGPSATAELLDSLRRNGIQVHGGNKGCARAVAEGRAAFGLTDTDDAVIELDAGRPVRIVYPGGGDGGRGTLFLPNTIAMVRGAPHPSEARALMDHLLTVEVEERLASGPSAQIPLHEGARPTSRVRGPRQVRAMAVDFEAAAATFAAAREMVEERFLR